MNMFPLEPKIITDLWNRGIQNINFSIKSSNFQPKVLFLYLVVFLMMFTNIQNNSLNNFNTHYILMSDSRDKYFNIHDSFKLLKYPEKKVD